MQQQGALIDSDVADDVMTEDRIESVHVGVCRSSFDRKYAERVGDICKDQRKKAKIRKKKKK